MEALRIQADAILVSPNQILRPGQLVVRHGKIVACSADCTEQPDLQFPDSLLSAGLVNAHTHLEFSDLTEPFPAGANFPQWIGSVIRHRRKIAEANTPAELVRLRRQSLQTGYIESHRAGVALIGDIVTRPWSPSDVNAADLSAPPFVTAAPKPSAGRSPALVVRAGLSATDCLPHLVRSPAIVAFPEIIGLDEPRFVEAAQWAMELAGHENRPTPIHQIGVSPHAPYSIHFPTAVRELASNAARRAVTAMHIAESLDEREWLEYGTGPFREVFEKLGVPADSPRASIIEIVEWLTHRDRALLVHGNYLSEMETELVANSKLSIVYCPRTHQHFGHAEYPLRRYIDAGINVVLGTDSRSSNPDLDLWNEVVALRESHPWVSPKWAFSAVTERAAEALGCAAQFGTLHTNRMANINVSALDSHSTNDDLLDALTVRSRPFTPLVEVLQIRNAK